MAVTVRALMAAFVAALKKGLVFLALAKSKAATR